MNRLIDTGHTVIVIDHNLAVIKRADYILDLGPEGEHKEGQLLATSSPEKTAKARKPFTGKFLAKVL